MGIKISQNTIATAGAFSPLEQETIESPRRGPIYSLLFYGSIMAGFAYLSTQYADGESYGLVSLLPSLLIIFAAIKTKKPLESLFASVIAGLLLLEPTAFITSLGDISMGVCRTKPSPGSFWFAE